MTKNPVISVRSEQERMKALDRYDILDSPPESAYDDVTRLACGICNVPIAVVTLVDRERQWFKSCIGLNIDETSREVAFCSKTIDGDDIMEVKDATRDERFRNNPLVTGEPHIVFYAGAPLITPDGYHIGTVCVIDRKSHELTDFQREALRALARQVIANLELRVASKTEEQSREKLVAETKWQRDLFFERSLDMLVVAGFDGRFHVTNPACTRILGYSAEELRELNYFDLVHPDELEHLTKQLAALADGERVPLLDVRIRTKSGEYRDIRWNSTPWEDVHRMLAVGRDVTKIRNADREINEQELMLRRSEQLAQIGSWQYELAGDTVRLSSGLKAILDRSENSASVNLDHLLDAVIENDRPLLQQNIEAVAEDGAPRRIQCHIRRPNGEIRTLQTSMDVVRNNRGQIYGVIGASLDITDVNETVERLRHSESRLRALSKRMEQIREEERAGISREIHDELGQMLTALKIGLTVIARDVADSHGSLKSTGVSDSLLSMGEFIDTIIKSVRTIATSLRPQVLDSFGLIPAIEWHANEFEQRTEIKCTVDGPESHPELDDEVRTALFRITLEAMTNAARHASADEIVVSIKQKPKMLELKIIDNGHGVSKDDLAATKSLGVLGMHERAKMIGASFGICGETDAGTTVCVCLPMTESRQTENSVEKP